MRNDPSFQQEWANREKHSAKELAKFQHQPEVWGLHMEPLGDYVNGEIVPFPNHAAATRTAKRLEGASSLVSSSTEPTQHPQPTPEHIDPDQLAPHQIPVWGANTEGRHGKGLAKLMFGNYPHSPGTVGERAVYGKGEGYHEGRKGGSYAIVTKDLAKGKRSIPLDQIGEQIDRFLELARKNPSREFLVTPIGTGLAGYSPQEIGGLFQGKELPNNVRLPLAFSEKANHPVANHPLAHLQPLNSRVAGPMQKDIAMAEMATQFVGRSAAPQGVPSSTRNYEQAWGSRANTGNYTANDVVMVSGSGPWRGVTEERIQKTFQQHYVPLLERAIAARATIVVGNAKGTDQLVQQYLQERGYNITVHPGSQNLPTPFLQCQPPIREKTMNESQFYNQIAQKYAPVIAALLYYERTNNYEGSIYRATWDGTELKLFDKDSDQPKLAAQYNDQSQKYEAISLQNSTARLTAKDIDILEGLAVSLQKQGIIEGLQQRSYLDLDF